MKKVVLAAALAVLASCKKEEPKHVHTVKENTAVIEPENPLNKLKYENKIDYYCKMDITKYGVSDTITYKGRLYGFCSTVCKDEFMKKPEEYLAAK